LSPGCAALSPADRRGRKKRYGGAALASIGPEKSGRPAPVVLNNSQREGEGNAIMILYRKEKKGGAVLSWNREMSPVLASFPGRPISLFPGKEGEGNHPRRASQTCHHPL